MNVEFVAHSVELDDQIRQYAENKLSKLTKFLDEPIEIRLSLAQERHRSLAELRVAHRFGLIQAAEETEALLDSINMAVDKAQKQARRSRKKYIDKRRKADRNNGSQWPVEVFEAGSLGTGSTPRIIKSSVLSIKPMSLDEAALHLDSSKNDFVVFRDATSDQVNVLYKRKDNNYGLISPE
jgi:putative sigma-54 modulation protein